MSESESVRGVKPAGVRRGEAREKLLAAAQQLIVAHGVEGTSIRAINAAAGVSPGILHYHFGSLDALVTELVSRHMEHQATMRRRLLEERSRKALLTERDIAEIIALPMASLAIDKGEAGIGYVRLISRLYSDRSTLLEEIVDAWLGDSNYRISLLLQKLHPEVNDTTLALRLGLAGQVLMRGLEEMHLSPRPWAVRRGMTAPLEPWDHVEQVLEFMAAGLAGGPTSSAG